jgi:hypothetical protein
MRAFEDIMMRSFGNKREGKTRDLIKIHNLGTS